MLNIASILCKSGKVALKVVLLIGWAVKTYNEIAQSPRRRGKW
jgi:hypothetical protein